MKVKGFQKPAKINRTLDWGIFNLLFTTINHMERCILYINGIIAVNQCCIYSTNHKQQKLSVISKMRQSQYNSLQKNSNPKSQMFSTRTMFFNLLSAKYIKYPFSNVHISRNNTISRYLQSLLGIYHSALYSNRQMWTTDVTDHTYIMEVRSWADTGQVTIMSEWVAKETVTKQHN